MVLDLGGRVLGELVAAGSGVVSGREVLAAGVTRATLRWAVSRGDLIRLRPAVFTTSTLWSAATVDERHILQLRAAQRSDPALVACGTSAAILLGLPVPQVVEPQLATAGRTGRRDGTARLRPRRGPVSVRRGIRLTTPVVTVVDCALRFELAWGLAVADAAIFKRLVTPEALREAVAGLPPQPGLKKARWVAEHAKPKVESPLESLARAAIVLAGLPEPEPQVWVQTRIGRFRVDMLDLPNRVVTEADGKLKYVEPESVWKEKGRQDALRDFPLEVVRFTMADHHNHPPWLAGYRRALARAARLG